MKSPRFKGDRPTVRRPFKRLGYKELEKMKGVDDSLDAEFGKEYGSRIQWRSSNFFYGVKERL